MADGTDTQAQENKAEGAKVKRTRKRVNRPAVEGEVLDLSDLPSYKPFQRSGVWKDRVEWFQANPNTPQIFKGVSPTIATHLKKLGLRAYSCNTREQGQTADVVAAYFDGTVEVPKQFLTREEKKTLNGAE